MDLTLQIFSTLEHKWLSHLHGRRKTRILSIDGGGTTGITAGLCLVYLEDQIREATGDPSSTISDFFDIVAGTGIGALFAAMLTSLDKSPDRRPLYSAAAALRLLSNSKLFKEKRGGVFRRRKYLSGGAMDAALKKIFKRGENGEMLKLKEACKPLLIPCFDLITGAPFVFSRADAVESDSFDFEMWKVCRATMANPGRFKPFSFSSTDGKTLCHAVDGGVVMNNPTSAAVTHVLNNRRDFPGVVGVEDLLVLSLGNGERGKRTPPKKRCSAAEIVDIVAEGVSETVDQMVGNAFCWNRVDYVRVQGNGGEESEVLKEKVVEAVPFGGKRVLAETNGERIREFARRIVDAGKCVGDDEGC